MKIAIAGTGYVGLVTGVCMAEHGHEVICVDVDKEKVELLNKNISPIYEEGLEELMEANTSRITYTTDFIAAYKNADIVFIAVGTPERRDGSANLSYVFEVSEQIAQYAEQDCVVIVKSTVPIGTNDKIEKITNAFRKDNVNISVVSNPEFLSQGTAVKDALYPARIVVGTEDIGAEKIMRELYKDFNAPLLMMNRRSAEMVKYASNDFLALKISYINEIANLCEGIGADIEDVAAGMGYDARIGNQFLKAGIGYGGSCFPKDTKALHWLAVMKDYEIKTIKAAIEVNEQQKFKLIKKARKYYDSFEGLTVAVLGLTFKPGTDDIREAPSLVNIPILLEEGALIRAWDPAGKKNFKKYYPHEIGYCESIDDAIKDADICFIFTDWDEIKKYDAGNFRKYMNKAVVLDGRNCFDKNLMRNSLVIYESVGR